MRKCSGALVGAILIAVMVWASNGPGLAAPSEDDASVAAEDSRAQKKRCLSFGSVVRFKSDVNQSFMRPDDHGNVWITTVQGHWGNNFVLVDPSDKSNQGPIAYGISVALRTYKHNAYLGRQYVDGYGWVLRADAKGPKLPNDLRWTFLTAEQPQPSCIVLDANWHVAAWLKPSYAWAFLQPDIGLATTNGTSMTAESLVHVYGQAWSAFYYDSGWPSGKHQEPCPYRGRWDGANCLIGISPYANAKLRNGEFYGGGSDCFTLGSPAGTYGCRIGSNPQFTTTSVGNPWPFIEHGTFYLSGSGSSARMRDSCALVTGSFKNGSMKACALPKSVQLGVYPATSSTNIASIGVCYKKAGAATGICKNAEVSYAGSHVIDIRQLAAFEKYKFSATYRQNGVKKAKDIGEIKVTTSG